MERKLALLVGNGIYGQTKRYSPLEKSVADVQTLAEPLRASNIGAFDEVQILIDQPMHLITQAIERLFQEKKPNDLLLLYLTGHGDIDRRMRWYFVCNETQPILLSSTAISASFIRDVMDGSHSDRQIVILDTCYAGAFFTGAKGEADIIKSTSTQLAGSGRSILAATSGTQLAWEGDKQTPTSIFTRYLVQGLTTGAADTNNSGTITVDGWFDYTSDQVRNETGNQTPRKQVENQQGSIIVARNPFWVAQGQAATVVEETEPFTQKTKEQWADEGIRLYEAGDYAGALAKYKQALILDPEYASGYLNRGRVFATLKDYQGAVKNYTYALTFDPTSIDAYYQRSLLYSANREYQKALEDLRKVLTLDPTSTNAKERFEEVKKRERTDRKFTLKKTLVGHSSSINCLAISLDGQTMVSGSSDKTVKVWNLQTGTELYTLRDHTRSVCGVAISPDGQTMVSGSGDEMKVWDLQTGKELRTIRGFLWAFLRVVFSPDGQTMVSSGHDAVRVWNWRTGTELRALRCHVQSVAISPDGQTIISGGGDDNDAVKIWDLQTGKELRTIRSQAHSVGSIAISSDGHTLVGGGFSKKRNEEGEMVDDETVTYVTVWDWQTGQELCTFGGHHGFVDSVAISSNGQTIVSGSDDIVKVWDWRTGQELCALQGHNGVDSVAITPDEQTIVSGGGIGDRKIKIWGL